MLVLAVVAVLLAGLTACGSSGADGPLIVVFSDLGTGDYALARLKGDIYATHPEARVADGAVSMPALDVAAAAYIVDLGSSSYPEDTIFVSTTNPGDAKGTVCLAAVTAAGHIYLAPDNGTLTRLARRPGFTHVYRIGEQVAVLRAPGDRLARLRPGGDRRPPRLGHEAWGAGTGGHSECDPRPARRPPGGRHRHRHGGVHRRFRQLPDQHPRDAGG